MRGSTDSMTFSAARVGGARGLGVLGAQSGRGRGHGLSGHGISLVGAPYAEFCAMVVSTPESQPSCRTRRQALRSADGHQRLVEQPAEPLGERSRRRGGHPASRAAVDIPRHRCWCRPATAATTGTAATAWPACRWSAASAEGTRRRRRRRGARRATSARHPGGRRPAPPTPARPPPRARRRSAGRDRRRSRWPTSPAGADRRVQREVGQALGHQALRGVHQEDGLLGLAVALDQAGLFAAVLGVMPG